MPQGPNAIKSKGLMPSNHRAKLFLFSDGTGLKRVLYYYLIYLNVTDSQNKLILRD